jgi:Cobalamin-independent synthase, Catalytic domain
MRRSTDRILTTHVGSLPRTQELIELNRQRAEAEGSDQRAYSTCLAAAVASVVQKQREIGIDILNDGEYASHAQRTALLRPVRARGDRGAGVSAHRGLGTPPAS